MIKKRLFVLIFVVVLIFGQPNSIFAETESSAYDSAIHTDDITIETSMNMNGVDVNENSIHLVDGGVLKCSFSVRNSDDSGKNISVIFATYTNNNQLNYVESLTFAIQPGKTETKEIEYEFDITKESTGKIMFWNGVSTLIPIKGSIYFDKDGVTSYFYDSDNRLIQADKSDGTSIIFSYDNKGNLLRKTIRK